MKIGGLSDLSMANFFLPTKTLSLPEIMDGIACAEPGGLVVLHSLWSIRKEFQQPQKKNVDGVEA